MSRIGKQPVSIPSGVECSIKGQLLSVKGKKGQMTLDLHPFTKITSEDGFLKLNPVVEDRDHWAICGTMRALVHNMVVGVTQGFEKKLLLMGVGYRSQAQGQKLTLVLGFSHPVEYAVPQGITIETPTPTEIIVKGFDKQLVGEVAAKIRAYRPPEPYKGKGVRYAGEYVMIKEAKKK